MSDSIKNKQNSVAKRVAHLLDSQFSIPGTNIRFGLDPVIGLIPGAGDWITGLLSVFFMVQAARYRAEPTVLFRMFFNIVLDITIGFVPLLGDLFDISWKANTRNAKLLAELHHRPDETVQQSRLLIWTLLMAAVMVIFCLLFVVVWLISKLLVLLF